MKKMMMMLLLSVACVALQAQQTTLSGIVTDAKSGNPIAQATVAMAGVSVVTNDDGMFTLKVKPAAGTLTVSHIGYRTMRVKVSDNHSAPVTVRLQPTAIQLKEVVVWNEDPWKLIEQALEKVPDNYNTTPQLYRCFYRETAQKRSRYIYVAEGVVDMYKTGYQKTVYRDRVAIVKGRRLVSPKQSDTLGVKVLGGPTLPVQLDVVKNTAFLLNQEELSKYTLGMAPAAVIDDRLQYVITLIPYVEQSYPLSYGKLYIDRETLAFTRVELSLDMSDRQKASNYMLHKKPHGVRFKPKEMNCLIDYRTVDGKTTIHYVRNTFRFGCDWKRRLFSTNFTAVAELVVTDRLPDVRPISGRESFDSRDAFFDHVDYFRDPDFWKDYNIIEPTESLDKGIGKIIKKHLK